MSKEVSLNRVHFRASFYWAFVQTSNAKLAEAECREKLLGMLGRNELTLPAVKQVLTVVCHRVEASRPMGYVGIEGLLQLLGSVMTLAKKKLSPRCFESAKEFMISRLNHLRVLCMSSVPIGVRDGQLSVVLSVVLQLTFFQPLRKLLRPFSAMTSMTECCSEISSSTG